MANDGRDGIEWRLRRILQCYQEARSVGDFKDAVLGVHTALEDVLNLELGPEARDWPFGQKFQQMFPDLYERYRIDELNRQRNHYAHPKRVFVEIETRETAQKFVELAIQVWPQLFHTSIPVISSPPAAEARAVSPSIPFSTPIPSEPSSLGRRLDAWRKRRAAPGRSFTPFFRLPWLSVLLGIGLLAGALVLAGLIETSLANHLPGVWYWIALPAALLLACAYFAGRSFWRFLRSLGLRRLAVGSAGGLLVAVLAVAVFTPSTQNWGGRLAGAAAQVLDGARQAGLEAASYPLEWGQRIANETLSPLIVRLAALGPKEDMEATPQPENTPGPSQTPSLDAALEASKMSRGAKVRVRTDGSRLRGRQAPGLSTPVGVYFPFGEELTVVDGPLDADGYTWWKVEGKAGSGWSAENYLVLIP